MWAIFMSAPPVKLDNVGQIDIFNAIFVYEKMESEPVPLMTLPSHYSNQKFM